MARQVNTSRSRSANSKYTAGKAISKGLEKFHKDPIRATKKKLREKRKNERR